MSGTLFSLCHLSRKAVWQSWVSDSRCLFVCPFSKISWKVMIRFEIYRKAQWWSRFRRGCRLCLLLIYWLELFQFHNLTSVSCWLEFGSKPINPLSNYSVSNSVFQCNYSNETRQIQNFWIWSLKPDWPWSQKDPHPSDWEHWLFICSSNLIFKDQCGCFFLAVALLLLHFILICYAFHSRGFGSKGEFVLIYQQLCSQL